MLPDTWRTCIDGGPTSTEQQLPNTARPLSRRQLLRGTGYSLAGAALAVPLSSCAGSAVSSGASASGGQPLKIGFVSPRTGATAGFGEPDSYVLDLAKRALAPGLKINGQTYQVTVIDKDSQSNPQRSAQVANDLINN